MHFQLLSQARSITVLYADENFEYGNRLVQKFNYL